MNMQQQVLGSNIYSINFFDELYCYKDSTVINKGLHLPQHNMIITTEEYPQLVPFNQTPTLKKEQYMLVAFEIIKKQLPLLQYPLIEDAHIINPFEEKIIDLNARALTSLKIKPLLFQGKPSLIFDVRQLKFSINNCLDLAKNSSNIQITDQFEGKYVRTIYFQKEYWFKIKKVHFDFDMNIYHKNELLLQHLKKKYKINFGDQPFIFETDQVNLKKKYLIPELCELNIENTSTQECSIYCNLLVYWNNIFNFNQQFIQALKDYKIVIAGSHIEINILYLDPGTISLANGITKKLSSLVYPRNQSEFDQYYENFFLTQNLTYTTNLKVSKWVVFRNQYNLAEREYYEAFFESLRNFSNQRSYKLNQPEIIELGDSPKETIKARLENDTSIEFVFVVANKIIINSIYNGIDYED